MILTLIGKKRAENIVEYRNIHGNFNSVDELRNVPGITPEILCVVACCLSLKLFSVLF